MVEYIIKNKGKKDIDLAGFGAYLLQLTKGFGLDVKNYNISLNDYCLPEILEYENNLDIILEKTGLTDEAEEIKNKTDLDCWKLHGYWLDKYPEKKLAILAQSW